MQLGEGGSKNAHNLDCTLFIVTIVTLILLKYISYVHKLESKTNV